MGLSASQARLLSITARLTDNELHSQMIANSKVRLADQTQQASADYIKALDTSKLVYSTYDANGEQQCVELTPSLMYAYAPLKNQYAMMNPGGQIMVSALDAKNYEETNSLAEFLDRYDLMRSATQSYTKIEHNPAYDVWVTDHKEWEDNEPDITDSKYIKEIKTPIQTWIHSDSAAYDSCSTNIRGCFAGAKDNKSNCYMHVLSALIGVGEHKTSDGNTYNVYYVDHDDEDGNTMPWSWNTYSTGEEIGDVIRESLYNDEVNDEAYSGELLTEAHGKVICSGDGSDASKYNKPYDPAKGEGGYCYQKAVDMLYKFKDDYDGSPTGGMAAPDHLAEFFYFIEFDLGRGHLETTYESSYDTDNEKFEKDHDDWVKNEPVAPPIDIENTYYKEVVGVNDKDKAQWYTNLWNAMNGSSTSNLVVKDEDNVISDDGLVYVVYNVSSLGKVSGSNAYKVLDENLMNSSSWLKFALEQGVITLSKAEYSNPTENSAKALEITGSGVTWKYIGYSAASDIHEVDDEKAIAKAEAEYTKKLNEIEAKDKQYDNDLKKLDTEHNALQTEYESIANVINKNTERSFKAFS